MSRYRAPRTERSKMSRRVWWLAVGACLLVAGVSIAGAVTFVARQSGSDQPRNVRTDIPQATTGVPVTFDLPEGVGRTVDLTRSQVAAQIDSRTYIVGPGLENPGDVCLIQKSDAGIAVGCDPKDQFESRGGFAIGIAQSDGRRTGALFVPVGYEKAVAPGVEFAVRNSVVLYDLPSDVATLSLEGPAGAKTVVVPESPPVSSPAP